MAATVTAMSSSLYRAMEAGHERSAGEWQIEWHVLPQVAVLTAGSLRIAARVVAGACAWTRSAWRTTSALEQGRTLSEAYMFELAPELGRENAHDVVYAAAVASKEPWHRPARGAGRGEWHGGLPSWLPRPRQTTWDRPSRRGARVGQRRGGPQRGSGVSASPCRRRH